MEGVIEDAYLRPVFDSRGGVTLEAELESSEFRARAIAPSGKSRGRREAAPFPPGGWRGALKVFGEEVRDKIIGFDVLDQQGFDSLLRELDGTEDFSRMGGSAAIALSMALARLASALSGYPLYRYLGGILPRRLPRPVGNVIGGGAHTIGGPQIQEFLVVPMEGTLFESVLKAVEAHRAVPEAARRFVGNVHMGVNDERAWALPLSDRQALEVLREVAEGSRIGIDAAASQYFRNGKYRFLGRDMAPEDYVSELGSLIEEFGLFYVEDPAAEDDLDSFKAFRRSHPRALIVGDDVFTTNPRRIRELGPEGVAGAVLIKPNQVGTVTETLLAVEEGRRWGMEPVVSHRSGDSCDDFISHLAVAVGARFIKTGVLGGERTAKLNELIRIEEEMRIKA